MCGTLLRPRWAQRLLSARDVVWMGSVDPRRRGRGGRGSVGAVASKPGGFRAELRERPGSTKTETLGVLRGRSAAGGER